jgi:hypothetical protein
MDDPIVAAIYRAAILRFRANAFVGQMMIAFNASPHVWATLCKELDPLALDTMFDTVMPKTLACSMTRLNQLAGNDTQPSAQQPNPSEFSFKRLLSVNGELAGMAARASFSNAAALREACTLIETSPDVHDRLELLDISWKDFHQALCRERYYFRLSTADTIFKELETSMVNVFAQTLWLAGSSREYRRLICAGYSIDGKISAFNGTALRMVGMGERVYGALGERCSAVET